MVPPETLTRKVDAMITYPSFGQISLAAITFSLSTTVLSATDSAETNTTGTWIESVMLIGEKTERSLKETTSSVSVIVRETLDNNQYYTISEAVGEVANVVSLTGSVPDIRGVKGNGAAGGFNSISGGAKARVSTLIDGVAEPFVADLTGDSGIWDVEQIEVYRGPQSTSNGRNSIGGSVYIKTADPTFEWEGAARVGYRNREDYVDTSVMVSGPLIDDKLAFRLTAQHLDAQTITDDQEYETNPADYDLNEAVTDRLKGKLLWVVNDKVNVMFTHSSNRERGDTGRVYFTADDPWEFKRAYFRDITTDSDTNSVPIDAEINDDMTLSVLVAHMDYDWGFDTYEANPAREQQLTFEQSSLTLDAKLEFGRTHESFNGFVGLAYFERDEDILSAGAFPYFGDDDSDSAAVYGEVDIALNERFNLILGGRIERESQERNFTYLPIVAQLEESKTVFLPKLALQYDIDAYSTLSFSARRGYNAAGGALNFAAQEYYFYDQETVNSYELSLRTGSEDGRLNVTANVFYNDYDGYQAQNSARFIVNMDDVATYGAELEAVFRPVDQIELTAGLGLLKTDIKNAGDDYSGVDGNELNSAPDVTANLGVKYWVNDNLSLGMSARYVAEYYGDIENTSDREAGDYTEARMNANLELGNWSLAAYVNNLFDEKAFTTAEPAGRRYPDGYVAVIEPRNFGISATYSF